MFVYGIVPGALQTTNATPNTENDCFFVKPGTGRSVQIQSVQAVGRAAAATALSGIVLRARSWTLTASSAGTSVTPTPREFTAQAAKCTAAYAVATVTSGTTAGGTHFVVGCGVGGPGGWVALNADSMVSGLESAATKSFDLFSGSGTASLNFEVTGVEVVEA